jgi:hypothetical protein
MKYGHVHRIKIKQSAMKIENKIKEEKALQKKQEATKKEVIKKEEKRPQDPKRVFSKLVSITGGIHKGESLQAYRLQGKL